MKFTPLTKVLSLTLVLSAFLLSGSPITAEADCEPNGACNKGPSFADLTLSDGNVFLKKGNLIFKENGNINIENGDTSARILQLIDSLCIGSDTDNCSSSKTDSILAIDGSGKLSWVSKDEITQDDYWLLAEDGSGYLYYNGPRVFVGDIDNDTYPDQEFVVEGDIKSSAEICNGRDECLQLQESGEPVESPWLEDQVSGLGHYYNIANKTVGMGALPLASKRLSVNGPAQISSKNGILISNLNSSDKLYSPLITAYSTQSWGRLAGNNNSYIGMSGVFYNEDTDSLGLSVIGVSGAAYDDKVSDIEGQQFKIEFRSGTVDGNDMESKLVGALNNNGHFWTKGSIDTENYYLNGESVLMLDKPESGFHFPPLDERYIGGSKTTADLVITAGPAYFYNNREGSGHSIFHGYRSNNYHFVFGMPWIQADGDMRRRIELGKINEDFEVSDVFAYFDEAGIFTVDESIVSNKFATGSNSNNRHVFFSAENGVTLPERLGSLLPNGTVGNSLQLMIAGGRSYLTKRGQPSRKSGQELSYGTYQSGAFGLYFFDKLKTYAPGEKQNEYFIFGTPDYHLPTTPVKIIFGRTAADSSESGWQGTVLAELVSTGDNYAGQFGNFSAKGKITGSSVGTYKTEVYSTKNLGSGMDLGAAQSSSKSFKVNCPNNYIVLSCSASLSNGLETAKVFADMDTQQNACNISAKRHANNSSTTVVTGYARCFNSSI